VAASVALAGCAHQMTGCCSSPSQPDWAEPAGCHSTLLLPEHASGQAQQETAVAY